MEIQGTIGLILSVISVITLIWKFGFEWSAVKNDAKGAKETAEKAEKALRELVKEFKELARVSDESCTKIDLFWEFVKQQLPNLFIAQRSQNLMEKLRDDTISDEELLYLEQEIKDRIPSNPTNGSEILTRILCLWAVAVKRKERGV